MVWRRNQKTQYDVLGYKTVLYLNDYKLIIEIDEKWQSNRNIDFEIKMQKLLEQKIGCKLIRIDYEKED